MKVTTQDRNTALTIALVLVVCLISLIAIGSFVIRLVSPGVAKIGEVLSAVTFQSTANYNFKVYTYEELEPEVETPTEEQGRVAGIESGINYNFELPSKD